MRMCAWWRSRSAPRTSSALPERAEVAKLREAFARLEDDDLKGVARKATRLPEVVALTAVVASRVLGLQMFDVQIDGALGLAHGRVVEMQTGEGKTLAAVPAVVW